ncbi:MAG: peroxiredoxin family protein, partial [Acidimicrobiales bacterium]
MRATPIGGTIALALLLLVPASQGAPRGGSQRGKAPSVCAFNAHAARPAPHEEGAQLSLTVAARRERFLTVTARRERFLTVAARMAPSFALLDIHGRQVQLDDFRGQVVVLNFWAFWCDTWKAEMPHLQA